jgi:flavin reductase (DIM6/NTAB) family NADH-FMN oxidoreductase RutF
MANEWKTVEPEALDEQVLRLIGREWMLITAGTPDSWNTMTASWGGLGVLWGKPVSFCFVRPTRHTFGFMNRAVEYTLSFFPEQYRSALEFCGSRSGRDVDKARETGLLPVPVGGSVAFSQARLVLLCRKLYQQDLDPAAFIDPAIERNYPERDYHRMYIGELASCLVRPQ